MNYSTLRGLLPAVCAAAFAACTPLKQDPGFNPPPATPAAGVPGGLDFDASRLTAAQCAAWLDQKLPAYIWHGEEKDMTLQPGRVILSGGMCRQYRTFRSPDTLTFHLREIPLASVTPAAFGPVTHNQGASRIDSNWSFTVTGPWTRRWETWDTSRNKVTSSGTAAAGSVILYFTSQAAATQARAVMLRLAELTATSAGKA